MLGTGNGFLAGSYNPNVRLNGRGYKVSRFPQDQMANEMLNQKKGGEAFSKVDAWSRQEK
jgi:hypothetical protein